MAQHRQNGRQPGRATPPAKAHRIDFGPKQRACIEAIQRDEGHIVLLQKEIEAARERIAANKGKIDLMAELLEEFGDQPSEQPAQPPEQASPPVEPTPAA